VIVGGIWDCFFFNDELDLLEARLLELSNFVDRFVLVEGDRTFSGAPKPLVFEENRERFDRWASKIVHLVARIDPTLTWEWDRENQQRAAMATYLAQAAPDDLILLGDVDEFPDRDSFEYLRSHRGPPLRLRLHHAVYFANWLLPRGWSNSTLAFRPDQLHEPMVRVQLGDFHREWDGYQEFQLDDAGLHASFLGGAQSVRRKLDAYSHQEYNDGRFTGAPHLERCLEYGIHFQGREVVRRLQRQELGPMLRRMSERPESAHFFNFRRPPMGSFRTRAYCGYTWLRARWAGMPEWLMRFLDRHERAVTGPGMPVFWLLDVALRLRRRLVPTPESSHGENLDDYIKNPPVVLTWR
jgi:Glycosyltransferase family 17